MSPEDVEDLKALLDEAFAGVRSDLRKLAEAVKAFGDAIERARSQIADGCAALRAQRANGFASVCSELAGTHAGIPLPDHRTPDDVPTD